MGAKFDELLDFGYANPESRENAKAALACAERRGSGLFVIDSNVHGTGKSTLARVILKPFSAGTIQSVPCRRAMKGYVQGLRRDGYLLFEDIGPGMALSLSLLTEIPGMVVATGNRVRLPEELSCRVTWIQLWRDDV